MSMYIHRLNAESANADPIVLREGTTTRLVFKPTIVNNRRNGEHPLGGDFIYQKKGRNDEWEDEETARITSIESGTGIKLALNRDEIDLLLRHWQGLYAFYRQNGIPVRRAPYSIQESVTALNGTTSQLLEQVVAQAGETGLAAVLKWAIETSDVSESVKQLSRLDAGSLQKISAISGISVLKRMIDVWNENKSNDDEAFWQRELSQHSFVFSQVFSAPVVLFGEKAYIGGKGIDNRGGKYPDVLMKTALTSNLLILELKTPQTTIVGGKYRPPNVYGPSPELAGAVVQATRYKDTLLKQFMSLRHESDEDGVFHALMPQCVVVAGHTDQLSERAKRESFELFRNNLRECNVITYDELFEKTRCLIELLEGSQEEQLPF